MKRRSSAPLRLDYPAALRRMFRGSKLIRTNGRRVEYAVTPGGPISDATAARIIDHSLCRADDQGLLPEKPQSWLFRTDAASDN
jgi:hypothetical protein